MNRNIKLFGVGFAVVIGIAAVPFTAVALLELGRVSIGLVPTVGALILVVASVGGAAAVFGFRRSD